MSRSTHSPSSRSALLYDLLAVASLWLAVALCFWRIGLAGRVLAGGDMFTYFYPYWAEATRAVRAGRLPLWNPYLFMGAPLLANSQVGFFYPLNWLLWLLLPAHRSVHATILLHLGLGALNGYLWGRRSLRLGRPGAWAVGAIWTLGGYLGAQIEHVNQLQGLAWLPLMLMLYDRAAPRTGRSRLLPFGALGGVVGLVLLAGHTQTAFIALVGLALYGLGPLLGRMARRWASRWRDDRRFAWPPERWRRGLARRTALLIGVAVLGAALAAIQLIPTAELVRYSVRAGGLPFNERVSFSLPPLYLARALLPGFWEAVVPERIEYVAYVGVAGLALAWIGLWRGTRRPSARTVPDADARTGPAAVIFLAGSGLFLALGLYNPLYLLLARFLPGFAHFRVPARWLTLYALGMAALAGWGADALFRRGARVGRRAALGFAGALVVLVGWAVATGRADDVARLRWPTIAAWLMGGLIALGLLLMADRRPRLAGGGLVALLLLELLTAGSALPHSQATAGQAFTSLRPSIAHLLAADDSDPPARFISMSDITFDPGDLPEIQAIYGPQLSTEAVYQYVIATKQKEVLSPALPLAFGIPAVDGYDGGVLPLARYVTLQRLFLPDDEVSMDGRLRENLTALPAGRWLNLFNVRYIITDKLHDAWLDGVFYDLQFRARLARGEEAAVAHVPPFEATALGVVSHLQGGAALPDGAPVALVEVGLADGEMHRFTMRAGEQTAEGMYGPDVAHASATVGGHFWPGQPEGSDYVTRLRWPSPATVVSVSVRGLLEEGRLVVRGVSLIDERTGSFQSLVLSNQGRFRLVHSGDVKIYENLDLLPRAFLVRGTGAARVAAEDDAAALALMREEGFDPAAQVVLSADASPTGPAAPLQAGAGGDQVGITEYTPERIAMEVTAGAPGYVVLTDAWYPGWRAYVDGQPAPIQRADLYFRAVPVEAGRHRVLFTFRPRTLVVGVGISLAAWAVLTTLLAGLAVGRLRSRG